MSIDICSNNLLIILVCLFALLSLGLGIYSVKLNTKIDELKSNNKTTDNNIENNNTEQLSIDCSFTKTFKIVNLMEGYIAAVPERSSVIVTQFQMFEAIAHGLPTELKENLKVGEYYEFTVDAVNAGSIDGMISVVSNKLTKIKEKITA